MENKDKDSGTPEGVNALEALKERLAELMHIQWAEINTSIIQKMVPVPGKFFSCLLNTEIERRLTLAKTPYAELSEADKDKDREQADRVLALIGEPGDPSKPSSPPSRDGGDHG